MEDSYRQQTKTTNCRQQTKTTNGRQLSKTAIDNKLRQQTRQLMGDN